MTSESSNTAALVERLRNRALALRAGLAPSGRHGLRIHDACLDTEAADALSALAKELEEARAERDEADRRAGAAERENANRRSSDIKRQDWLDERKRSLGYDIGVSFDRVWDDTLAKACRLDEALAALKASEAREGEMKRVLEKFAGRIDEIEQVKAVSKFATEGTAAVKLSLLREARAVLSTKEM